MWLDNSKQGGRTQTEEDSDDTGAREVGLAVGTQQEAIWGVKHKRRVQRREVNSLCSHPAKHELNEG